MILATAKAARAGGHLLGVREAALVLAGALLAMLILVSPSRAAFPGRDGLLAVQPLRGNGLILVGVDGRGARRICADQTCGPAHDPAWSADGRELVYVDYQVAALSVVYADGSCLHCLIQGTSPNVGFTPSGDILKSGGQVDTLGVDGLGVRRVLRGPASAAVWSAQGRLAFVRRVHGHDEVFVTNQNRRHPYQLTRTGASSPSWAPDGRGLAVVHAGWVELIDLHGRRVRLLARGGSPAFAPDGRSVAYVGVHYRVMVISARGGRARPVGSVRGRRIDWQPVSGTPPLVCRAPAASRVVASSPEAVVTDRRDPSGTGNTAYLACLRSLDRERYLGVAYSTDYGGAGSLASLDNFVLAGDYVAFLSSSLSYYHGETMGSSNDIEARDLLTDGGWGSGLQVPYSSTPGEGWFLVSLVLSPQGFGAWETQVSSQQAIFARDGQGTRQLDTTPSSTSSGLANLNITSDQATWTHDGQPMSATLRH